MKISKIIGTILIVVSLAIGYIGINKISNSTNEISVLGLNIEGSNKSKEKEGYIYLGVAVLIFVGGIYSINSNK